ncbi:DNA mismatch repair endonuclease MutL [Lederbergia lenta]|uniref:DNA mismatch repair protein MutL n=1 Tax=Lederbergia lenta TaxID=1467 RepID=A0A2X4Z720_LEDLE|nr:DNA mismatch repair endonuclease MutL [Lederbergia lenta]MEC2324360.1 DNA mismatch repair endonuclease MutL [Lederbergia lenta]SQI60095.1 DNA mismatch repair protein [Lederbergia lenta]
MRDIIELDDALSNKIAAGEVVERPSSVVKELVENALDANSSIIEIDIEEAGLGKIRVIDNGKGIREDDVLSAFKRHATSKIKNENDLFRIRTLGFRGEALPSIASVSHLELITARDGEDGTKLVMQGGNIITQEKAVGRRGTDITISNLFFNTPARLKYLRSLHTEIGHISDIMNRLALSHPNVSFRLRHNDRSLLHTNGNGDVLQVLSAIYGINIAKKMIPIHASSLDFTINGYISLPEITRASRNYLSTMVNGRFIKNYSLVRAIMEGYHTLLPIGRYPIALLSIVMDPLLVDVNVHPAKLEVRLSKDKELNELIALEVKKVFKQRELIPQGAAPVRKTAAVSEQTSLRLENRQEPKREAEQTYKAKPYTTNHFEKAPLLPTEEMKKLYEPDEEDSSTSSVFIAKEPEEKMIPVQNDEEQPPEENKRQNSRIPQLYPIGQMHGTYIFAQNEEGLYMIDQHAAQERIKYEYYREKVGQVENELQDLLVPLTLDFSPDEYVKLEEYKDDLEKVGIFLEEFGMNSYMIRSHPQWFPNGEEQETIEEILEQVLAMKKIDIKKLREEAAIMMSCKASIKANRFLRNDEIQSLLNELRLSEDPFTCPHGRPIMIHYSISEMEKMFKRIM